MVYDFDFNLTVFTQPRLVYLVKREFLGADLDLLRGLFTYKKK